MTYRLRTFLRSLALLLLVWSAAPSVQAVCSTGACVTAGPRLASVDSNRSALMNALLGGLSGASLNLAVTDWNALASGNLSLGNFFGALQTQTSTASTATALAASATLAQVANAAATAAQADGNTAVVTAFNKVVSQLGSISPTIKLGDMLTVALPDGALATSKINALELLSGSLQLFNYKNVASTPTPISLSGASIGQAGLTSVALSAQVIEPPVYVCGAAGSTFHTAAIRIKLDLSLLTLTPSASGLNLSGLTGASVGLGQLQLYVELARADGTITAVNAVAGTVGVQVTPGVAALYLGSISDSVFFNRSHAIVAGDLSFGNIGSLTLTIPIVGTVTVAIQAKALANGGAMSPSSLSFSAPWPQTKTASAGASFASNLVSTLLGNLQIQLSPSLGLVDAVLQSPLITLVQGALSSTLSSLLTGVVTPLLDVLGIRIGEVDVTVTGIGTACAISGYVYNDVNHNVIRDTLEAGCGIALYVKLVPSATPAGPALAVAAVDSTTGAYSFASVGAGSYLLVVNSSATLSSVTPAAPLGWLGTETPTQSRSATVSTADLTLQNFGLFRGSKVSGTVFRDNGVGSGVANNGTQDGTETGIAGVTVKATDSTGATVLDSAVTTTAGAYTLWIPFSAGAAALKITETNPAGHISVGGSAGTTGGTYTRVTDTVDFVNAIGSTYTGVNFADVPDTKFSNDNQRTILPGEVVFYPHVFVAGTTGQLTLSASGTANPTGVWGAAVYLDLNCNGSIDAADSLVSAALAVTANQTVCLVARVTAPVNAPFNAQYTYALNASFSLANSAIVWTSGRSDLTIVGRNSDSGLRLVKSVDRSTARSGDVITYTIQYENQSAESLGNLRINDATPVYTTFGAAGCGTQPAGISACVVSQQPAGGASGSVAWTLSGTLAPGAVGSVSFSVTLQ